MQGALLDAVDFAARAALDGVNRDVPTSFLPSSGGTTFIVVPRRIGPGIDVNGLGPSTTLRLPPWMIGGDWSLPSEDDGIFGTSAFGPKGAANAGPPIRVLIVTDAAETQVDPTTGCIAYPIGPRGDPDRLTIVEGCRAEGQTVLCSSSLVEALTQGELQGAELVLLLAHELAHIRHGDSGAFAPAYSPVDLSSEVGRKFELMRSGCDRKQRQDNERRADKVASHALLEFLVRFPMRSRTSSAMSAFLVAMGKHRSLCDLANERFEDLTKLVSGFRAWRARLGGFGPTSIATDARQILCGKSGVAYYPRLDSHPSVSARMLNIVDGTESALQSMVDAKESKRQKDWYSLHQEARFDYSGTDTSVSPPPDPSLTIRFGSAPTPGTGAYQIGGLKLIERHLTPDPPPPAEPFNGCIPPSASTRTFLTMFMAARGESDQVKREAAEIARELTNDDTTEEGFCRSFEMIEDSDPAQVCAAWNR